MDEAKQGWVVLLLGDGKVDWLTVTTDWDEAEAAATDWLVAEERAGVWQYVIVPFTGWDGRNIGPA